jgi:hypothetical protein
MLQQGTAGHRLRVGRRVLCIGLVMFGLIVFSVEVKLLDRQAERLEGRSDLSSPLNLHESIHVATQAPSAPTATWRRCIAPYPCEKDAQEEIERRLVIAIGLIGRPPRGALARVRVHQPLAHAVARARLLVEVVAPDVASCTLPLALMHIGVRCALHTPWPEAFSSQPWAPVCR